MPKKKKSIEIYAEEHLDTLDNASVVSLASEDGASSAGTAEADEQTILERICGAIENFSEKRPETRVKALTAVISYLRLTYLGLDSMAWNHSETFVNGIEYILKKGRLKDRALAAECLAVMCGQYDPEDLRIWLERLKSLLETIIRDNAEPCSVRGKSIFALTSLCFFSNCDNYVFIAEFMVTLESVFRASCPKGDGRAPVHSPDVVDLHLVALQSWTLLLSVLPICDLQKVCMSALSLLLSLLKGCNVNVKISVGESIALIYERMRSEVDCTFRGPHYKEFIALFSDLSTDCDKSHSKDDRKRQRQTFREIVGFILHDESPNTSIRFGSESVQLFSSATHFYYNFMCDVLGAGLNHHLRFNCFLRNLFDLGPPKPSNIEGAAARQGDRRASKLKRNYDNQSAFRVRTQMLNARRDKRANALNAHGGD